MTDKSINGTDSLVAGVFQFWREFQLEALKSKLDGMGLKIAEQQESSLKSRKGLATATKEFKKLGPEEQVKDVSKLLKSYQEEVDALTKRAKFAESSFLELYQALYEAPDPAPALGSAMELVSQAASLQAKAEDMSKELEEYREESGRIKNQQVRVRELTERCRELEDQLRNRDAEADILRAAAAAEADRKLLEETREREEGLTRELEAMRASLKNLQGLHSAAQSQLFRLAAQSEEEQAARQSEAELAASEVERVELRMVSLQKEKEALLDRLKNLEGHAPSPRNASIATPRSLRGPDLVSVAELQQLKEAVARLQEDLREARDAADGERRAWHDRSESNRRVVDAHLARCQILERELEARPTFEEVEELRRQVRTYEALGLALGFQPSDGPSQGSGPGGGSGGELLGPLESLLVQKNKGLEHELTVSRLQLHELRNEVESLTSKAADLEAEVAKKDRTVARLEEDLITAQKHASGSVDPSARPPLGADDYDGTGEQSMVQVLVSQRERLRARVRELEDDLRATRSKAAQLEAELGSVRSDNVALIERLKYVRDYQGADAARGHGGRGEGAAGGDLEMGLGTLGIRGSGIGASGAVERKYQADYESSVNPFQDFKERQKDMRLKQMRIAERAVLQTSNIILSSRGARLFVFFYTVAVHGFLLLLAFRHWASYAHALHHTDFASMDVHHAELMRMQTGGSTAAGASAGGAAATAVGAAAGRALRWAMGGLNGNGGGPRGGE